MTNEFKSFYKTVAGGEGEKCYYPTRLDPYGKGCFYNCKYCYAKKLLDFRKLWHPEDVAIADITKIYNQISKIPSGTTLRLGGMTDCFQPIEHEIRNTYRTIKMLNRKRIHYLIVTKSSLVSTKEYMDILDKELAHIQISVPTTDNAVLKDTDNAPPYQERVEAIEKLQKAGYDVSIRLSPFLYETVDYDKLNRIDVDKCLVEFLRLTPKIHEQIKEYATFEHYNLKESGYRHLPLDKKLEVLDKLDFKENYNPNSTDCCNLRL